MTTPTIVPPARLLLATDLSARSDRALDRAAQLAKEWSAELIALNVLDAGASPATALAWAVGESDEQVVQLARRQLTRDLAGLDLPATMRIVSASDPARCIAETATSADCGLVVTGVARNELLGRFLLGSMVERLARALSQPLLVVRNRPHGAYRQIVVATDFSETSRHALSTAAHLFPGRELVLYHACEQQVQRRADYLPDTGVDFAAELHQCAEFIAATRLPEGAVVRPVIAAGALEVSLTDYVRRHEVDLVALGAYGRNRLLSTVLGGSAIKLLDWLPCDELLVREPPAGGR